MCLIERRFHFDEFDALLMLLVEFDKFSFSISVGLSTCVKPELSSDSGSKYLVLNLGVGVDEFSSLLFVITFSEFLRTYEEI